MVEQASRRRWSRLGWQGRFLASAGLEEAPLGGVTQMFGRWKKRFVEVWRSGLHFQPGLMCGCIALPLRARGTATVGAW